MEYVLPVVLLLVCLLAGLCLAASPGQWLGGAYPSSKASAEALNFFPLLPWDWLRGCEGVISVDEVARGMAECGLTVAGFVKPEDLGVCEKYGLAALVYDPRISGYHWKDVNPEEAEKRVKAAVLEVKDNPAVMGFYVKDEPSMQEFDGLAVVVKLIHKYAPGKLAYINLFPDYATVNNPDRLGQLGTESYEEYLEEFVKRVPTRVISYDNYTIQADYSVHPSFYYNMLAIRAIAQKSGRAWWNVITSNQLRPFRPAPTPGSLAFQVYSTLAAGGDGVAYYTYFTGDKSVKRSGGYAHGALWNFKRTPVWNYLKHVNWSVRPLLPVLNRLESTGVYYAPAPTKDLPTLPGEVVESVKSRFPVMVGEFKGPEDSRYVMVVNMNLLKANSGELKYKGARRRCYLVSPKDGSLQPAGYGEYFYLGPGEGRLLKVK